MNKNAKSHSLSSEATFIHLDTSEAGLSKTQVIEKTNVFGKNCLPISPPKPAWKRFFAQFHNLLIYVLIGSGLLSALLHHYVDSGVILAVVVVNAVVGFIQEGKDEDSLRAICL